MNKNFEFQSRYWIDLMSVVVLVILLAIMALFVRLIKRYLRNGNAVLAGHNRAKTPTQRQLLAQEREASFREEYPSKENFVSEVWNYLEMQVLSEFSRAYGIANYTLGLIYGLNCENRIRMLALFVDTCKAAMEMPIDNTIISRARLNVAIQRVKRACEENKDGIDIKYLLVEMLLEIGKVRTGEILTEDELGMTGVNTEDEDYLNYLSEISESAVSGKMPIDDEVRSKFNQRLNEVIDRCIKAKEVLLGMKSVQYYDIKKDILCQLNLKTFKHLRDQLFSRCNAYCSEVKCILKMRNFLSDMCFLYSAVNEISAYLKELEDENLTEEQKQRCKNRIFFLSERIKNYPCSFTKKALLN